MKFLTVTALFIITLISKTRADNSFRIYCGRELADTMSKICYYTEEVKRTSNEIDHGRRLSYGRERVWYGPRAYHAYSGLRGKRGIIDDCCYQPCSIATLMTYC